MRNTRVDSRGSKTVLDFDVLNLRSGERPVHKGLLLFESTCEGAPLRSI